MTPGYFVLSDIESNRFGLRVARARVDDPGAACDIQMLAQELETLGADVAILRMPAGDMAFSRALADAPLRVIHADTLVYQGRLLADYVRPDRAAEEIDFGPAYRDEAEAISALAARSFGGYTSHYHANPLFEPALINEGYAQWARSHLDADSPDRHTHVARADGRVVAFLTTTVGPADRRSFEIVLNAVDPEYARKGIYSSLFGYVLEHFRDAGFAHVSISTQIWNYAVQRVWARHGLKIERAYDTFHINLAARRHGATA